VPVSGASTETNHVAVRVDVSAFALAVVLVLWALDSIPVLRHALGYFVGIIAMDIRHRCHVGVCVFVLREMDGQVSPFANA
jgi:hypothetical protein